MRRNRPTALATLFALAFVSLMPFLASARMLATDGPVEHCHRLNVDSIIDTDPMAPEGPSQPRKAKCPFCAMAAAAAPATQLPLPCFVAIDRGLARDPYAAEAPCGVEVEIPLSRGPPRAARI